MAFHAARAGAGSGRWRRWSPSSAAATSIPRYREYLEAPVRQRAEACRQASTWAPAVRATRARSALRRAELDSRAWTTIRCRGTSRGGPLADRRYAAMARRVSAVGDVKSLTDSAARTSRRPAPTARSPRSSARRSASRRSRTRIPASSASARRSARAWPRASARIQPETTAMIAVRKTASPAIHMIPAASRWSSSAAMPHGRTTVA